MIILCFAIVILMIVCVVVAYILSRPYDYPVRFTSRWDGVDIDRVEVDDRLID